MEWQGKSSDFSSIEVFSPESVFAEGISQRTNCSHERRMGFGDHLLLGSTSCLLLSLFRGGCFLLVRVLGVGHFM